MEQRLEHLVRETAKDWYEGRLSSFTAMTILYALLNPVKPMLADIEWARQELAARGKLTP
jgi:hypothetical protein